LAHLARFIRCHLVRGGLDGKAAFGSCPSSGARSRMRLVPRQLLLELYQDQLEAIRPKVLREMLTSGSHEHLPSLAALFLCFPIRRSESDMQISQENRHGVWVPVHHRLLARSVTDP